MDPIRPLSCIVSSHQEEGTSPGLLFPRENQLSNPGMRIGKSEEIHPLGKYGTRSNDDSSSNVYYTVD